VLSSDLGRVDGPFPDTGLAQFIREFAQRGFTEEELRQMTVLTPRALVE
jgi:predicted metal-dependent phosphotriesterase family hydrolase